MLDVPATLAARVRLLGRGHGRKTDGIDAASVARVAQSQPDLRRVGPEDHSMVLRLLSDRRDELTRERRRVVNRLHRLLRDLLPGGAPTELSTEAGAGVLNRIRPKTAVDLERKVLARVLVADLRRIDRALVENRARCTAAVAVSGTTLTSVFGISDVLATTRFRSREDLQTTIERYVKLYNDHLPQRALGHQTPLQALRIWRKDRPEMFVRRPNNQAGLDN